MKSSRTMDKQQTVREKVREGYAAVAVGGGSCCGPDKSCCGSGDASGVAKVVGYSDAELATLPEGANMGLSCGNPGAIAALRPGETVLDLGSGGGFDVFLVAQQVGPKGRAIGVDMTPEMLAKARRNTEAFRKRTKLDNVEFRLGEIEHLPVADASVDVVISNCVVNLSPDKPQVWREIARVLKPGGRVAVGKGKAIKASELAFQTGSWQTGAMNKAVTEPSNKTPDLQAYPEMRKSRCAQQSFAMELKRLRSMSIEERVVESLGMDQRFAWMAPTRKDR